MEQLDLFAITDNDPFWIDRIAAKLYCDGIRPENHTPERAEAILSRTAGPVFCIKIYQTHTKECIKKIQEFADFDRTEQLNNCRKTNNEE